MAENDHSLIVTEAAELKHTPRLSQIAQLDALIMKGGGVKGLAFAGAVRELEHYFSFNTFVGTSAGSIAAALLAAGFTGAELEVEIRRKRFRDFLDGKLWKVPFTFWILRGIHPGITFMDWLRTEIQSRISKADDVTLQDLPKRTVIYAARKGSGDVTFDSHWSRKDTAVHTAVRCSMSIPYFFQPQWIDNRRVYDGGLLNNYPVQIFLDQERGRRPEGQPEFIALYLGSVKATSLRPRSVIVDLLGIWLERNDAQIIDLYRSKTVIIDTDPISTIDFDLTDDEKDFLVLAGRAAAFEFLWERGVLDREREPEMIRARADTEELRERIQDVRNRRRERRAKRRKILGLATLLIIVLLVSIRLIWPPPPCKPPTPAMRDKSTSIAQQALVQLKNGNWNAAVQMFGQALNVDCTNTNASDGLWTALTKYSPGRLDLPDRAYKWPEGALLQRLAPNGSLALIAVDGGMGKPPNLLVYNYESGNQISVAEPPLWTRFLPDSRHLVSWAANGPPHLITFDDSRAWPGPKVPNGWYLAESISGDPTTRHDDDALLTDGKGHFRWWNINKSAWADAATITIPSFKSIDQSDRAGHYLLWQDANFQKINIRDLIAQKPLLQLPWSLRLTLSANGGVLIVTENGLPGGLRDHLAEYFALWIVPEKSQGLRNDSVTASGNYLLETQPNGDLFVRQRDSTRVFYWSKQVARTMFERRWQLHPTRDELFYQSDHSLCVYALPSLPYFLDNEAPLPPQIKPGTNIDRFVNLVRQESAVTLCAERDKLHKELLEDEAFIGTKTSFWGRLTFKAKGHFPYLSEEWRNLFEWWTTRPGDRKPWK